MNACSIRILNNSGSRQTYSLFSEVPRITGRIQGKVWQNILAQARTPAAQEGKFNIYQKYYAVCGSINGSPADGVSVGVTGTRKVTLGSTTPKGAHVPGTTLQLVVEEHAPEFSHKQSPACACNGSFAITTSPDFTIAEAVTCSFYLAIILRQTSVLTVLLDSYTLGFGISARRTGKIIPAATFIPHPNIRYQIQPITTYYITSGDFAPGNIIDISRLGPTAKVDYNTLKPDALIIHDEYGKLNIQEPGSSD